MTPSDYTEEKRLALRQQALDSTYVMAGVIGFHDITPHLHLDMCDWIDGPGSRKLGMIPRDHLKTSLWTIAHTVRLIVNDPNIRILLGNETATNSQHFLRRIQAVFSRNQLFQWLFPELIHQDYSKVKWSETEMQVPRSEDFPESTVEAIGVGGAVVSRHYTRIKLDDLVGKEASESAEVMKKTIDWYVYAESLLVSPTDPIDVCGTHWSYNDLYHWIKKNEGQDFSMFLLGCYGEPGLTHGDPIWPERFPEDQLQRLRRKYGSFKFSCQYLNDPRDPESASFNESWLRYYERFAGQVVPKAGGGPIDIGSLHKFMRVDPAISEKPGAARSAIVVDGVYSDGRIFLLEAWAKRCHPFEMIERIFDLAVEYDLISIGIESVAYQRILKPVIEAEAERRGVWLNIVELKPDTREKKENRIRGIQPYLERGLVHVRLDQEEFLDEYKTFPVGSTVDVLDAFAYGPHQWSQPIEGAEALEDSELEEFRSRAGRDAITGY